MNIGAGCVVLAGALAQMNAYSANRMVMGNVLKQDLTLVC
jgi:hypothetical protein